MNLSLIDWTIIIVAVVALRFVSLSASGHMKGVADFLSANRSAGRYLLTIAGQMGGTGVISFIAMFELYYAVGFSPIWWGFMSIPVGIIILLTGWVFYRFRETRALTLAQFFEMRYSRRFRIFAGILCWITGILNFGIFPAVAARFFIHFCGLPDYFHIPGLYFHISTFASIMALDLSLALMFVMMGGQVSVMITECVQGIFCGFAFIIISAVILMKLQWPSIVQALNTAPVNASMLNPFQTSQVKDFNVWFFMIGVFGAFYGYMTWQGNSGFNSAARTPHEQKMGGIIGILRNIPQVLMTLLLTIAAFAIMHLPEFANKAAVINNTLSHIDGEAIRSQMLVPVALANFLPVGIKGLLATVMIFVSFTCHDTYMHSWGTIFIQDVYMPIRNRPLDPEEHIRLLRWSIVGVAVFSFLFSLLYPQTLKILMFMAITGTIWIAGSGAAIIGGLYWKRGTTAAAYCSLVLGAIMGVTGLVLPQIYKSHYHSEFPVNSQWLYFIAMCLAVVVYVVVSLLTGKKEQEFNLERMLHRGRYSNNEALPKVAKQSVWLKIVGISEEFSFGDRVIAISIVVWNFSWLAVFVAGVVMSVVFHAGGSLWADFWHFYIWAYFVISVPVTIWFAVGGVLDIRALFNTLKTAIRDDTDDGRVIHQIEPTPIEESIAGHSSPC